jgi:hypothetical protein
LNKNDKVKKIQEGWEAGKIKRITPRIYTVLSEAFMLGITPRVVAEDNKEVSNGSREFRSIKEFEEYYLPEYCKKYPITMRVTEDERRHILTLRGQGKYIEGKRAEHAEKKNKEVDNETR